MKQILTTIFVGIFLASLIGCGGNSAPDLTQSLPVANFVMFNGADFSIQHPKDWKIKKDEQLDSELRKTIQVALISNFKDPFFTPVITVEKIGVAEGTTSLKFAEGMVSKNESGLVGYEEVERKDIVLSGAQTLFVRFRGKEKLQDNVLEFLQVYLVKGTSGFIVTGAYDPFDDDSEVVKIAQSLESFLLK